MDTPPMARNGARNFDIDLFIHPVLHRSIHQHPVLRQFGLIGQIKLEVPSYMPIPGIRSMLSPMMNSYQLLAEKSIS